MTEKWVNTYVQYQFKDGSWVNFAKGLYDSTNIMSDCVRPSWDKSGEYRIELVPSGKRTNWDADFVVITNKDWANKIYYNLTHSIFDTMEAFKETLRYEGKKAGTYERRYNIIKESVRLGL